MPIRWDIKIASHYFVAAAFFAVCVMAAPDYLHLTGVSSAVCFWGGVLGSAIFTTAAFRTSLLGEAFKPQIGHARRMVGLYGMVVCAVGFVGFAATYFWVSDKNASESPSQSIASAGTAHSGTLPLTKPPTSFLDFFRRDYFGESESGQDIHIINSAGIGFNIPVRLIFDMSAEDQFLLIFLPHGSNGYQVAISLVNKVPDLIRRMHFVDVSVQQLGNTAKTETKDFRFSNIIYFYTEDELTSEEKYKLELAYKAVGVKLQFRGQDYYRIFGFLPTFGKAVTDLPSSLLPIPVPPARPAETLPQTSP